MRTWIVGLLLMMVLIGGCGSKGLTFDLLTYDNIIGATQEARKGVDALHLTVQTDTAHRQEDMLNAVGAGIRKLAENESITPEEAEVLAAAVTESLRGHLANYREQERRLAKLYGITVDNLDYIIEISERGRKFSLYRADIGQQWREYIETSARDAIGSLE